MPADLKLVTAVRSTFKRMPKVLQIGGTGTGKSYNLRSVVEAGLCLCTVETEPSEILDDLPCIPPEGSSHGECHRRYITPAVPSWEAMMDNAKHINTMNFKMLTDLVDPNRHQYRGWFDVLSACANYKCDRCGKVLGDVTRFTDKQAFALDTLSGLNIMAMELQSGAKPVKSQGDWQIAMDNEERFINKLTTDTRCLFILNAHAEREVDEISGGVSVFAGALGRKMGPKLPRFFSDVIHCRRDSKGWYWSTLTPSFELKGRNVAWAIDIKPDFGPLLRTYEDRYAKGLAETDPPKPNQT